MKIASPPVYRILLLGLLIGTAPFGQAAEPDPWAWYRWRGPEQNGVSRERGLPARWNPRGGSDSNLLWKRTDLGSRSTPIVMRGKLYTIVRAEPGTAREGEKVVCLDAATGKTIWENRFNVYLSDVPDTRVAWSCCAGDPKTGRIYAQGVCGLFQCLDGETGQTLWSHSLHEEFGLLSTYGGRTNVPVVFENLVIASAVVIGWDDMAKPAHRFMAFDKQTGQMVWFAGTRLIPYDTTYSTPTVTVLNGQAAMVFGSGDGAVWALQPRTGRSIWSFQFSRRGLNVSPLVVGDRVYTGHSEENITGTAMGGLVAIDGQGQGDLTGQALWQRQETMIGKSSPLLVHGTLIAIDDRAKLFGFDPETGEQKFRKPLGTVQRSSPLVADGKIYTITNNGRWYTLETDGQRVRVLHKMRLARSEASDGSPIVSGGRLYVPTSAALYCIGKSDTVAAGDPIPEPPTETPSGADDPVAHVQVIPCEVLLRPGDSQAFRIRTFNERGQLLEDKQAALTLEGPGQLTDAGVYTAPADGQHVAARVVAQAGQVKGTARIRIVPPLPWRFDFETNQEIPITWIGGRVRHVVRKLDGQHVAVKRDLLPAGPGRVTKLGTRSRCWMGQTDLSDYTIQADVQGTSKQGKMPDIGLINQRYTMELQGASQKLQIRSWSTQLRMASTIDMAWQPDVWYTMKFTCRLTDGKAHLQGKLWPRAEAEPAEWTIEAWDEVPNRHGSPGLFGNAKDAEFYLDNLHITPNSDVRNQEDQEAE